jgi:hypothetical protein
VSTCGGKGGGRSCGGKWGKIVISNRVDK